MSGSSEQLGKHNAFKAARLEAKTARKNRDMSRADAFYNWAKSNEPEIYQRYVREEAWSVPAEAYWDAKEDEPSTLALWDELNALYDKGTQQQFNSELTLLGIEAGSTKREIRNAYRRKARKLHPDVGGNEEAFKQLHTAYRHLLATAKE